VLVANEHDPPLLDRPVVPSVALVAAVSSGIKADLDRL